MLSKGMKAGLSIAAGVGLVLVIGMPSFIRARRTGCQEACINNLRQIDGAKDQCAIEVKAAAGDVVSSNGVAGYIKGNEIPKCPAGGTYRLNKVGENPTCTIGGQGHSLP